MVKKYKATTNSNHNLPVAENLVNQNFEASKPNEKWLSDITYIPTEEGWLYLAGVLGFICSMSRKGNCYDNALMESFWGKLKMEWLNERAFKTRAEAKKAVFEYIELFYNRRRTHSSNDYVPPFKLGVAI